MIRTNSSKVRPGPQTHPRFAEKSGSWTCRERISASDEEKPEQRSGPSDEVNCFPWR